MQLTDMDPNVHMEALKRRSIEEPELILAATSEPCWLDPISDYLKKETLPQDEKIARKIRKQALCYVMIDGKLYKKSHTLPLLKCLRPPEAAYALEEVHEGLCGNHLGGRALSFKILRQGYYWPNMQRDAVEYVKKCDACQRHAAIQRRPSTELTPLSSPWPFAQWGMDILGPFPTASGQRKFLFVAIDYFTKWVEAEPVAQITEAKARSFVWKSIICRFGLPRALITDNGRQFDNKNFYNFCSDLGVEHRLTSVAHPQSNGEAEVTNRTILQGIKARLTRAKASWADDLYNVLWAYRTTPRVPTGESPFKLTYGTEAVIPLDIGLPSLRIEKYNQQDNEAQLRANLDFLEEDRERAALKMAEYQRRTARYYNSRVKNKEFQAADLVLRRAEVSQPAEAGKLSPKWEGPYRILKVVRPGAYQLQRLDGTIVPRTWNSENLRKYYQ